MAQQVFVWRVIFLSALVIEVNSPLNASPDKYDELSRLDRVVKESVGPLYLCRQQDPHPAQRKPSVDLK